MASQVAAGPLPSRTSQLLYSWIILSIFGTGFMAARFYARFAKSKAHGWDDYFLGVALVRFPLDIRDFTTVYAKVLTSLSTSG